MYELGGTHISPRQAPSLTFPLGDRRRPWGPCQTLGLNSFPCRWGPGDRPLRVTGRVTVVAAWRHAAFSTRTRPGGTCYPHSAAEEVTLRPGADPVGSWTRGRGRSTKVSLSSPCKLSPWAGVVHGTDVTHPAQPEQGAPGQDAPGQGAPGQDAPGGGPLFRFPHKGSWGRLRIWLKQRVCSCRCRLRTRIHGPRGHIVPMPDTGWGHAPRTGL